MNKNDESIKRGDVMKRVGRSFTRDVHFSTRVNAMIAIADTPAVPQEMSAREYGETLMKMCASHTGECRKCELGENKPCAIPYKRTIPIVEAWAREHPEQKRKTYAEDFKERFGHSWNNRHDNWMCREKLYHDNPECTDSPRCDCEACWNEEMEE